MATQRTRLTRGEGVAPKNRTFQTGIDMGIMPIPAGEENGVRGVRARSRVGVSAEGRGGVRSPQASTNDKTEETIDKKKEANDYLDQYKNIVTSVTNAKPADIDTGNSYKPVYKKDDEEPSDFTSSVDLNQFDELLSRLEASKKRQVRQKSVEDRRGTYAQGIASMMSNF